MALLQHQEALAIELGQTDLLPLRQRMAFGQHGVELLLEQLIAMQVITGHRQRHDCQINAAMVQAVKQRRGHLFDHPNLDSRTACASLPGPITSCPSHSHASLRPGSQMSAGEELKELKERAEKAHEDRGLAPVSMTMAVVAVLVATVALLGHRAHTEEILLQNKVTDTWAYYQAKNLRRNNLEALDDVLSALQGKNEKAEQVEKRFEGDIEKYHEEQNEIQKEAHALEGEFRHESRRANRFDLAEVFLEISLVVTSITLLTGRSHYWIFGMILAAAGIVVAATVLLLR